MLRLLPIDLIPSGFDALARIDEIVKEIYRLITFSRPHTADALLNRFLASNNSLAQLLGIKNAQMEAQSEQEAGEYLVNLDSAIEFVIGEIESNRTITSTTQLFQIFRIISPQSHARHPNRFRETLVQIGSIICPEPHSVPGLVTELFETIERIDHPVLRAIYFHHELIRIHPFCDGNGRTTRIAKNWMLMYDLYPPIFIKDEREKSQYVKTLGESFGQLARQPSLWNDATARFFDQEMQRLEDNTNVVLRDVRSSAEVDSPSG